MGHKKVIKKSTEQLVYSKLEGALSEIEPSLNKKKFDKKLRMASKLLAGDISKAVQKSMAKQQAQAKKAKEEVLKQIKKSGVQDSTRVQVNADGPIGDNTSN